MKITALKKSSTNLALLQTVVAVWKEHPLRCHTIDLLLTKITVIVEETEFEFSLNPDNHPEYILQCASKSPYDSIPLCNIVFHELTHLIDRFNPIFSGRRPPEEVTKCIKAIPRGDMNESVLWAFNDYWNTYIDGRLNKQAIVVYSLVDRINYKFGSRKGEEIMDGERESIEEIWSREVCLLDELIRLAYRFPHRRAKKYWIN